METPTLYLSDTGFVNTKREASPIRDAESVELIEEWLRENAIPSTKKYKENSYALKHRAEAELHTYLTNGAFIQACMNAEILVERIDGGANAFVYADFVDKNPIKMICRDHRLTYAQLSEHIGYGEEAISKAARTGELSRPMAKSIDLFTQNMQLLEENKTLDELKILLARVMARK